MRLDLYLYQKGYTKSRQKAKCLIEAGSVTINGNIILKSSYEISESENYNIEVNDTCPYVSRGGLKLEKILEHFGYDCSGKTAIDIGASTGGFTDCLLMHSAKKVFSIDSGTNQLDKKLLDDKRVISIENYNARNINLNDIGEKVDIITIDVSFISQTYILPQAIKLLKENGIYISLIKPQFELGKEKIGKGGIVKDKNARYDAVLRVIECAKNNSFNCIDFIPSPITGGDGNIEYLAVFSKNGTEIFIETIKNIIARQ